MTRKIIKYSAALAILLLGVMLVLYIFISPRTSSLTAKVILPEGSEADSIVVFKEQRVMQLFNNGSMIKIYNISLGRNPIGHKEKEGDKKTPEGWYYISGRNPNSSYHLSLRISYPNETDKQNAKNAGYSPGGDIMIHGFPNYMSMLEEYYINNDWTDGCIAVTNDEIEEIWKAVKDGTPIYINK
jgi:murein L,D-transpeptidase YafK